MTTSNGASTPTFPSNTPDWMKDPTVFNRFEELISNALMSRQEWMRKFMDPRRDIDDECGFPKTDYNPWEYGYLYDRDAIAGRAIEILPRESWQVQPNIYEDENSEKVTEFEDAWDKLGGQLRGGGKSWYQDEESSPIWPHLLRADILSRIGQYGIILTGLDDAEEGMSAQEIMRRPVKPKKGSKLLYIRCFPEYLAQITRLNNDPTSHRFGEPEEYLVTFNDPKDTHTAAIGVTTETLNVHWSRVVHIADVVTGSIGSSEIFAKQALRVILNNILSLRKLYGGSAEMYWRGAFPGWSLETHPQLGGDVIIDKPGLRDMMEQYMNGLQRHLALSGMSAKSLAPQVVDPTAQINAQLNAICIKLGVPMRIFQGSERGHLASSQDDGTWNDRLRERQKNYITPKIIVPFVDRLIAIGVLPEPKGYSVEWPDLASQTAQEKATIANTKTAALTTFIAGNGESVFTPLDFLVKILGFDEEEAGTILENSTQAQEEKHTNEGLDQLHNPPQAPPAGALGVPPPLSAGKPGMAGLGSSIPGAMPPRAAVSQPIGGAQPVPGKFK